MLALELQIVCECTIFFMKQNKELIMEDIIINLNEYTTEQLREVFGEYDSNIKYLSTRLGISVARDADGLKFVGDDDKVKMLEQIIDILLSKAQFFVLFHKKYPDILFLQLLLSHSFSQAVLHPNSSLQ